VFLFLLTILSLPVTASDCGGRAALYADMIVTGTPDQARVARAALASCDDGGQRATAPPLAVTVTVSRTSPDRCARLSAQAAELVALGGDITPFQGMLRACPTRPSAEPDASGWSFLSAVVTSPFGWRQHPILHRRKFHDGVDLDADKGDRVPALAGGRVVRAGRRGGYGLAVEIDHGGGDHTLYGHNSKLLVKKGQVVQAGEIIAEAGTTGLSTGVHVHLEVRRAGKPVDPMPFIRQPWLLGD